MARNVCLYCTSFVVNFVCKYWSLCQNILCWFVVLFANIIDCYITNFVCDIFVFLWMSRCAWIQHVVPFVLCDCINSIWNTENAYNCDRTYENFVKTKCMECNKQELISIQWKSISAADNSIKFVNFVEFVTSRNWFPYNGNQFMMLTIQQILLNCYK